MLSALTTLRPETRAAAHQCKDLARDTPQAAQPNLNGVIWRDVTRYTVLHAVKPVKLQQSTAFASTGIFTQGVRQH
jgi:hypothetical protein